MTRWSQARDASPFDGRTFDSVRLPGLYFVACVNLAMLAAYTISWGLAQPVEVEVVMDYGRH